MIVYFLFVCSFKYFAFYLFFVFWYYCSMTLNKMNQTNLCGLHSVFPSAEVVEHACSVTSLMLGETLPSITKDMDTYTYRLPIGVCAGITPFNFPAMVPLWMFPMGMVSGNTYLLKPSERVPTCAMLLVKMMQDAGAPDGTLNVIHGQHAGESCTLLPLVIWTCCSVSELYLQCRSRCIWWNCDICRCRLRRSCSLTCLITWHLQSLCWKFTTCWKHPLLFCVVCSQIRLMAATYQYSSCFDFIYF